MKTIAGSIILLAAMCAALYLLYENGYVVTQMKRAIAYIESKKGTKASFTSCTGYTRRVIRFKESKPYHFSLTMELTKGELSAELLDSKKNPIFCLNSATPSADAELKQNERYYLVFRFKSASGKYALNWD